MTRSLSKSTSGNPNYKELVNRIDQPGDPLRNRLAANVRDALFDLPDRAIPIVYIAMEHYANSLIRNLSLRFWELHMYI